MMLLAMVLFATLFATWSITPAMCHLDASPVTATLHASRHASIHLLPTHAPLPPFTSSALPTPNVLSISVAQQRLPAYRNKKSNMQHTHSLATAGKDEIPISNSSVDSMNKVLKSHLIFGKKAVLLRLLNDKDTKSLNSSFEKNERNASRHTPQLNDIFKAEVDSEVSTFINSELDKNIPQKGGQNAEEELHWMFSATRSSIAEKPLPVEAMTSSYLQAPAALTHPNTDETFRYHRRKICKEMKTVTDFKQKRILSAKDSLVNIVHDRTPNVNIGSVKTSDLLKRNISILNISRGHFSTGHNSLASRKSVLYSDERNLVSVDSNMEVKTVNSFDTYRSCNKVTSGRCILKRSAGLRASENPSLLKKKKKLKKQGNLVKVALSTKSSSLQSNSVDVLQNILKVNTSHFINNNMNNQSGVRSPRYTRYIKNSNNLSSPRAARQHKKSNRSPEAKQASGGRRRRRRPGRGKRRDRRMKGLSLWIDSKQVKTFSGYVMEIFVIHNSHVLPYILDPNFEGQLPIIPAQVEVVNFTWRAGSKKYLYTFAHMYSHDESLLAVPTLSIPHHGRVPRKPRVFAVEMRCTGNASGIAAFGIGLSLHTQQGQPLTGTPLRLQLRKECNYMGPDPECNEKCDNGGVCDEGQRCVCAEGYLGPYCSTALCYPRCMNGGTCTSPGRCSCPPGFNGRHCEGGICQHKCQNGGKCIQKDTCECRRGFYGNQCEFSKCVIPCVNGGRCRDVNKCRCPPGFSGDHCEVILSPQPPSAGSSPERCLRRCRHGSCLHNSTCHCHRGYTGRWCRRRSGRGSGRQKKRVWV